MEEPRGMYPFEDDKEQHKSPVHDHVLDFAVER